MRPRALPKNVALTRRFFAPVILDLKGDQYRGTIRPGPTAMIVAMTRDGKLKVEAVTDEFVTLDASTRTDVMAKLDAVVTGEGGMDSTYYRRPVGAHNGNATANGRGRRGGDVDDGRDGDDDGGGGGGGGKIDYDAAGGGNKKGGKRRARGTAKGGGGSGPPPKRRKASAAK